jgi:hypothetical protein
MASPGPSPARSSASKQRRGHIGGTDRRHSRVNSGPSRQARILVDGRLRRCAAGPEIEMTGGHSWGHTRSTSGLDRAQVLRCKKRFDWGPEGVADLDEPASTKVKGYEPWLLRAYTLLSHQEKAKQLLGV